MLTLIFPTSVALCCLGIGILSAFQLSKNTEQNTPTKHLLNLINDSLMTFGKRLVISIIQVIIYITIALFTFSSLFKTYFSWKQISAFILGSVLMTLVGIISQQLVPRLTPYILSQSEPYIKPGLSSLYKVSATLSLIISSTLILGLITTQLTLGRFSIIGYGLGTIFSAFFLRIGGGLYKASTDISADICQQTKKNIPHMDQRNAATILDISGDFISEILGFSSDLLSSFILSIISCSLFGLALVQSTHHKAVNSSVILYFPLMIVSLSLLASLISHMYALNRLKKVSKNFLIESVYIGVSISGLLTFAFIYYLSTRFSQDINILSTFIPYLIGLISASVIGFTAEYLTASYFKPTKHIAYQSEYGTAIAVINGIANGFKGNSLFIIYMFITISCSLHFAGFYGVALASLGMLSMTSTLLTLNIFSPLASNLHKISKLVDRSPTLERNLNQMNQIGHTTAAIGNGFSTGAATLSTAGLFVALILVLKQQMSQPLTINIQFVSGLTFGLLIPFITYSTLLNGLTKGVTKLIQEVYRQFKQIPYLTEDKAKPDMIKASDLIARLSMQSLTVPGLMVGLVPIISGYLLGPSCLFGTVLSSSFICITHGYYWANTGDTLNNAKNLIKSGRFGGKESPNYSHISIADNIGDAFKDLLSPSTNIMLKCLSIISILLILFLTTNPV